MIGINNYTIIGGAILIVVVFYFVYEYIITRSKNKKLESIIDRIRSKDNKERETAISNFDIINGRRGFVDRLKNKWIDRKHPDKTILVNMELSNGFHKTFLVKSDGESFRYKKTTYVIDNDSKYYILDCKIWALDYREGFTLPIKRIVPLTLIKTTMSASGLNDQLEYATNPRSLDNYIKGRIIQGIIAGQQLDAMLKKMFTILIVVMIIVIIHLLLFAQGSGMLENLRIPGVR